MASTPAAVCDMQASLLGSPQKACYSQQSLLYYCVPKILPCGEDSRYANSDTSIDVLPVCTHWPLPENPPNRGALGKSGINVFTGKCSCFQDGKLATFLYSDPDTPYCYEAPWLQAWASRDKYTSSEANKPIEITFFAARSPNVILKNAVFEVKVTTDGSDDSMPGTVTAPVMNADGYVTVNYSFPDFTKEKTDTIIVSCDICDDAMNSAVIKIKMSPTLVGFFNGVWNTEEQANDGLNQLRVQTNAVRDRVSVKYDLFYNQSGCGRTGSTCLQDLAETFAQRSQELDGVMASRWENFWDIASGRYTSPRSGIGDLLAQLDQSRLALAEFLDATFNAMLGQIVSGWSQMLSHPPTRADVAAHGVKLQHYADDDFTMMLVAHSQGNLFVNAAYDSLLQVRPAAQAKVVHIAPASSTLRGNYVLADIDLVINGLRVQGASSVPAVNISLPYSGADASGHTLLATYLDPSRAALTRVKSMIQVALTSF